MKNMDIVERLKHRRKQEEGDNKQFLISAVIDVEQAEEMMRSLPANEKEQYFEKVYQAIQNTLKTLPIRERDIIICFFERNKTWNQTLKIFEIKECTAKNYLYCGLKKLRDAVSKVELPDIPYQCRIFEDLIYKHDQELAEYLLNTKEVITSAIDETMKSLTPRERMFIISAYQRHLTISEIARQNHVDIETAYRIMETTQRKMREFMANTFLFESEYVLNPFSVRTYAYICMAKVTYKELLTMNDEEILKRIPKAYSGTVRDIREYAEKRKHVKIDKRLENLTFEAYVLLQREHISYETLIHMSESDLRKIKFIHDDIFEELREFIKHNA